VTRSQRLQPLARIADRRQQEAARRLQRLREELSRHEARLAQMRAYRQEYVGRYLAAARAGMRAEQIKEYQAFLARLDQAVGQLERVVEQTRQQCEQRATDWVETRVRSRVIDQAIARYRDQEELTERRREQKESDERSQRRRPDRE
jgi:flagellar FliJ protein